MPTFVCAYCSGTLTEAEGSVEPPDRCPHCGQGAPERTEATSQGGSEAANFSGASEASVPPTANLTGGIATLSQLVDSQGTRTDSAALPEEGFLAPPGYEFLSTLGRGGMGIVFKARHLSLNRVVALKMVLAGGIADSEGRARFKAEAEAVARLRHPHIVQVHDNGLLEGKPYLVMEYCEGGSLAAALDGTPLAPERAAALVEQLAGGVAAAHAGGIVHRDLKPGNVLLCGETAKIADFGLAKNLEDDSSQTRTGVILGTPSFMAPEQALGESRHVGPPADIYALGAILYQLLTGRPPFKAATTLETLEQVRTQEPVPPRQLQPRTPRDLETICLKCLRKDPARRYPSAMELAADLRRFQQGEPILARPVGRLERLEKWARRRPAVAGLLALSLLLGVGGLAGILWSYQEALRERNRAVAAEGEVGQERDIARNAEKNAEAQRDLARAAEQRERLARLETIRKLYHSNVNLAQAEWLNGNVQRAEELLDDCPPEQIDREWHFLKRLCHPEENMFSVAGWGHDLAYSTDGKLLATSSRSGVTVWDLERHRALFRPTVVPGLVPLGVALSSDGQWLAAAYGSDNDQTRPGKVLLWNLPRKTLHKEFTDFDAGVSGISFSPDSKSLAAVRMGNNAGQFTIWDVTTGVALQDAPLPKAAKDNRRIPFPRLAFSPRGKHLAIAADGLWMVEADSGVVKFSVDKALGDLVAFDKTGSVLACCSGHQVFVCDAATGEVRHHLPWAAPSNIRALAISADGKAVVVGDYQNQIRIWKLGGLEPPDILRGHRHWVTGLAFHPDGNQLGSISADGTVKFWDLARPAQGFQKIPWSYGVIGGNNRLLLVGAGHHLEYRDPVTNRINKSVKLLKNPISTLEPSRDWRHLALADEKGEVVLFELKNESVLFRLSGEHKARVTRLRFDHSGRLLVSACREGKIVLWNTETGKPVRSWQGKARMSQCLAFHPDGKILAFTSHALTGDPPLLFWDLENDRELGRGPHWATCCDFTEDGKYFATAGHQNAHLWKLADGPPWKPKTAPFTIKAHNSMIWDLRFSSDSRRLATWGQDGALRLWDLATRESMLRLPFAAIDQSRLTFSPEGNYLAAQGGGVSRIIDFRPWPGEFVAREGSGLRFLTLSPDQKTLAAPLLDGTVTLRDARDGTLLRELKGHTAAIRRVAFSPDGKILASASFDKTVRLWNLATGESQAILEGHTGNVEAVLFTPDGKTVVSSGQDGLICAWDVESGKRHYSRKVYPAPIYDLTMSPDGAIIAVAGQDPSVVVLETLTGQPIQTLTGHTQPTFCALFQPGGKVLATGSQDGTVKFWDTTTWKEQRTLTVDQMVLSMAFSPTGDRLAIGERSGRVQLWDVPAGISLASYPFHTGRLDGLAFTADGQSLFTGGEDGKILRWNLRRLE